MNNITPQIETNYDDIDHNKDNLKDVMKDLNKNKLSKD